MSVRRSSSEGNRRVVKAPVESKDGGNRLRRARPSERDESSESTDDAQVSDGGEPDGEGDGREQAFVPSAGRRTRATASRVASRGILGFVRLAGAALLLGGVTAGAFVGVYHYAHHSPRFAVSQVIVGGLRRVSQAAVLERAKIRQGQNIFMVDTDQVGRAILTDQWVQEVKVERRLPATLKINVIERDAAALAAVGDTLLIVTRQGNPFKRFEPGDPVDMPMITGVSIDEPGREPAVERRRIGVGLEVLRHYERTVMARSHVLQEIHLTPAGEVVVTIGKQGIALHLGLGPWAKKFAMAERVLGKLQGRKGTVSNVFLDNRAHPERVVVRMH